MKNRHLVAERFRESPDSAMLACSRLAAAYPDTISFAIGDPDLDTPALDIEEGLAYAKAHHLYHYGNPLGLTAYRDAVVDEYREDFALTLHRDEVMITSSGTHGMMIGLLVAINPGDEVILLSPFFTPYLDQVKLVHGVPVLVNLSPDDDWQVSRAALEQAITEKTKAIIVNTPQNPLGVCFTRSSLEAIAAVAEEHDLLVLADDIYTIFSYDRPFIPFLSLPGMRERTITIRSCSKDYCMTGFRVGYVIAPSYLIAKMNQANESVMYSAPCLSQAIGYRALVNRKLTREAIREAFKARLDVLQSRIARIPSLSVHAPEGTFYLFMDIRETGLSSMAFTKTLLETCHVLVLPGDSFGPSGEGFVRLAATTSIEAINEAFDRMEQAPFLMKA